MQHILIKIFRLQIKNNLNCQKFLAKKQKDCLRLTTINDERRGLTWSVWTTSPTVGGKRTLSTTWTRPPPVLVAMSLFSTLAPFIVMICQPIANS